jgi:hypothetical protein
LISIGTLPSLKRNFNNTYTVPAVKGAFTKTSLQNNIQPYIFIPQQKVSEAAANK